MKTIRVTAGEVQPGDQVEVGILWRTVMAVSTRPSSHFPDRDVAVWELAEAFRQSETGETLRWRPITDATYYTDSMVRVRR